MATLTLDADEQLLAGLKAFLTPALTGIVPAAALRSAYANTDLVQTLSASGMPALVVILLGTEKPLPRNVGDSSGFMARAPIDTGQTQSTALVPVVVVQKDVTITVVASGERGKTTRGTVTNALIGALGTAAIVPLPDSVEGSVGYITGQPTTYGLAATLVSVSSKSDDRLDERGVYRYDLLYRAELARYTTRIDSVVQGVAVTVLLSSGAH